MQLSLCMKTPANGKLVGDYMNDLTNQRNTATRMGLACMSHTGVDTFSGQQLANKALYVLFQLHNKDMHS